MKNVYLCHLIDGGFDSIFVVLTEEEWTTVNEEGITGCDDPALGKFFDENAPQEIRDRVLPDYKKVFDYCRKNKSNLKDGFVLPLY